MMPCFCSLHTILCNTTISRVGFVYTSTRKLSIHSDAIWLLALLYIKLCFDCEKRSISVHHNWDLNAAK
ncbi:hypothetical protein Hanom_Chr05g00438061 [Helianthus anomalus]